MLSNSNRYKHVTLYLSTNHKPSLSEHMLMIVGERGSFFTHPLRHFVMLIATFLSSNHYLHHFAQADNMVQSLYNQGRKGNLLKFPIATLLDAYCDIFVLIRGVRLHVYLFEIGEFL